MFDNKNNFIMNVPKPFPKILYVIPNNMSRQTLSLSGELNFSDTFNVP